MGYPAYQSPEQIEAQRRAIEQAKKESHDEGLKGHESEISDYKKANAQFPLKTDFTSHDIDQLKAMIEHANPDGVDGIGKNWKRVHDKLVGEGGGGSPSGDSAYGQMKKAVDGVLEHWEGESADQFKAKAQKILTQIANSASHAQTVSQVMTQAASDLRRQKDAISKIEKPSWFGKAWDAITDSGRDDKYTEADVKSGNIPKDLIAKANEGYIGAEKEEQLKAVAIMEDLGHSYVGYSQRIKTPIEPPDEGVPPSNPGTPMPVPIPAPSAAASAPSAGGRAKTSTGLAGTSQAPAETTGPRDPGISGGQQVPASQTKVDSVPSGFSGGGTSTVPGSGAASGAGAGGISGAAGGATAGVAGGGLAAGGAAAAGAARGAAGRAGIGGAGGRAGIGGAGGMGGRGGAGAAGGARGAAGAVGRGALAKVKGGVAGAPQGISGGKPATPGGTGLGRGRGGAAGASGRGAGGMLAGGARGTNQRPGDKEGDQGDRPDYLVEDEETWTPEDGRSVPKTIE